MKVLGAASNSLVWVESWHEVADRIRDQAIRDSTVERFLQRDVEVPAVEVPWPVLAPIIRYALFPRAAGYA